MEYITEPSRNIPVKYQSEILVLGGGPSGMSAAVSASKTGAKVMVIERNGYLGGQATGGMVIALCGLVDSQEVIIKGYCQDIIDYLEKNNASRRIKFHIVFEAESLKRCLDLQIRNYKIDLLLDTQIVDAITENDSIKYIIIENKSGRCAIKTNYVIDCTGDADSLKWCHEEFEQQSKDKVLWVTACFRTAGIDMKKFNAYVENNREEFINILNNSGLNIRPFSWLPSLEDRFIWFDISHINNIDITNADDLTRAELESRELAWKHFEFFKNNITGFENSYMVDIAPLLGIRDSRRLKSEHFITEADYGKSFEDCIALAPYYLHMDKGIGRLQVPYRSLIPKRINNLLVAGRAIGIEHKMINCIREIPCCMATGQAAGIAGTLASQINSSFRDININHLKKELITQGAYI